MTTKISHCLRLIISEGMFLSMKFSMKVKIQDIIGPWDDKMGFN